MWVQSWGWRWVAGNDYHKDGLQKQAVSKEQHDGGAVETAVAACPIMAATQRLALPNAALTALTPSSNVCARHRKTADVNA